MQIMRYEILNGTTVINSVMASAEFMAANYPDGNYRLTVDAPTATPYVSLTYLGFVGRLTTAERIAFRSLADTDAVARDFYDLLSHAEDRFLNDPRLVAGINYLTTQPAANPVLTADRAAAVLDPTK